MTGCFLQVNSQRGIYCLSYTHRSELHSAFPFILQQHEMISTAGYVNNTSLSVLRQGYVALSFAPTAGRMYPADAIIGSVGSNGPSVNTYYLSSYDVGPSDVNRGWATNMGAAKQGASTIVCFSRPASGNSAAKALTAIDPTGDSSARHATPGRCHYTPDVI